MGLFDFVGAHQKDLSKREEVISVGSYAHPQGSFPTNNPDTCYLPSINLFQLPILLLQKQ